MPFALQLAQSKRNLPGTVDSHEIADKSTPMLLSLPVQAEWGFIKNMRNATIHLEDYPDQSLEVAEEKGTESRITIAAGRGGGATGTGRMGAPEV